jgi:hypothetical protein
MYVLMYECVLTGTGLLIKLSTRLAVGLQGALAYSCVPDIQTCTCD